MQSNNSIKQYGAIIVSMAFFALSFVWFKVANVSYGPITIVFFRLIIASLLIYPFAKVSKRLVIPDKKDLKYMFLLTFFEPFLYFMGESYGLQYLSSTVAAVIIATIPLFTPFATYLFFKERITVRNIFGIIISLVGVCLVIFEMGKGLSASPIGVILQFSAVISAIGYTIVLHKISSRMNNLSIILFQNVIGFFYFLPFWLFFEKNRFINTPFDTKGFLAIINLAFFASTLAYIFFTYSVRKIGITKANMFTNVIPVFTAIFAWIILKDEITIQKFVGILIVIAGLFFAQMKRA